VLVLQSVACGYIKFSRNISLQTAKNLLLSSSYNIVLYTSSMHNHWLHFYCANVRTCRTRWKSHAGWTSMCADIIIIIIINIQTNVF